MELLGNPLLVNPIHYLTNMLTQEQMQSNIQALEKQGASQKDIQSWLDSLKTSNTRDVSNQSNLQTQPQEKGFLQKASDLGEKTFGKASEFLFGTTGKTVGTLMTQGLASGAELLGKEKVLGADVKKLKEQEQKITPTDIAFTALELIPGGGASKTAKVGKFSKFIDSAVKKLSGKAEKIYTEALSPTTKAMKQKAEKIIPELLKRKEAGTLKNISQKAQQEIIEYGSKIDEFIENIPKEAKVKIKPAIDKISDWKKQFIVDDVILDDNAVKLADNLKNTLAKFGNEVPAETMIKVRRVLDNAVSRGKGFLDDVSTLNTQVKKEATNAIREELAKDFPELAKINKEFTFWKNVDDVVGATLQRKTGQTGAFGSKTSQILGGVLGLKGGPVGSAVGAYVAKKLNSIVGSSLWKTTSAVQRQKIADALANGNANTILTVLKELGVATKNEIDSLTD